MLVFHTTFIQLKNIKPFEVQKLLPEDHPQRILYEAFNEKYDDENKVFLLLKSKKVFTPKILNSVLSQIESNLKFTKGINSQGSLKNAKYIKYNGKKFSLIPFIKNHEWSEYAKSKLQTPFWKNTLISKDLRSTLITFSLSSKLERNQRVPLVKKVLEQINEVIHQHQNLKIFYIGTEVANYWFTVEMVKNQTIITPLIFLIIGAFFFILFKSLKIAIASLLTILMGYALTIVMITFLENGIGPYSSFALFFVLIVSTADLIHFFTAYEKYKQDINTTIKNIAYPCFLTSITTAIGFSALLLNENIPIRFFGVYCAIGTFICYFLTFLFLPEFLTIIKLDSKNKNSFININSISEKLSVFIIKRKNFILFTFFALSSIFIWKSLSLTIDDNLYRKFKDSHPLTIAVDNFSDKLNFVGSVDLIFTPHNSTKIDSFENLKLIKKIENEVSLQPVFSHIQSYTQLKDNITQELSLYKSESNTRIQNSFLSMLEDYGGLKTFYKNRENEIRSIVFLKSLNSSSLESFLSNIEKINKKYPEISVKASGFSAIRNYINQNIIRDFIVSFSYSLLIILIVFLFIFRSVKWALLGILPNIFPLITISGLMGLFNITMESNLIILVSITIGIAVDDTIHFIVTFRNELKTNTKQAAIEITIQKTFKALLSTTLIYVLCFPVFLLADLKLFMQMGAFLLLSFIAALAADFFLLPALILGKKNDNL